jgi:hypothetical protein
MKFAGSTQNVKKMVGTSNQPIRTKNFPKKVCLIRYKCKGAKNLQAQPKILKQSSKHKINQSEQKFSQKKYV